MDVFVDLVVKYYTQFCKARMPTACTVGDPRLAYYRIIGATTIVCNLAIKGEDDADDDAEEKLDYGEALTIDDCFNPNAA